MRTKDLLFALALPSLFIACSDDLNETPGVNTNVKGNLVELAPDFALIQNDDAITRGEWKPVDGTPIHLWMPIKGTNDVYTADQIGLAWTGVTYKKDGTVDGVASALGAVSDRVFTNYKFTHFAWKINGKEPAVDICENIYETGTVDLLSNYIDATTGELINNKTLPTLSNKQGDPDVKNGLFNTENSTVYAGQYIAYAPYDGTNTSNYIMATSPAEMTYAQLYKGDDNDKDDVLQDIKNNIFMVGSTVISEGGQRTSEFTTKNLSGYVRVKLTAADGKECTLKKVILYDKDAGLLTKVGLSASAILDPNKTGKDLYLPASTAERETTSTITANIDNSNTPKGGAMNGKETRYLFIPVLPTEASKSVELILIDEDDKYVKKTVTLNVTANGLCPVEFGGIDFTNAKVLATDECSFRTLTGNSIDNWGKTEFETAEKDGSTVAKQAATNVTTVSVLGNIRLTKIAAIRGNYVIEPYSGTDADALIISKGITKAYGDGGANVRLTIHNGESTAKNPVIKIKMIIEAAGCCEDFGGRVAVGNAEIAGNVLVEGQKDVATDEVIKESLLKGIGTKHGWLSFGVNGTRPIISGKIENYGELQFGRFEREKESAAQQIVTTLTGTIENHNVMDIYRVIENTTGSAQPSKLDAKLDVKSNGKVTNDGTFTIEGVLAMSGTGSNEGGTIVDRVSSQVTGELGGFNDGEYICDVNNGGSRFKEAVEGNTKPTTVVRFVETSETYDFGTVNETKKASIKKYVVDAATKDVTLKGEINLKDKDVVVEQGTLKFDVYKKLVTVGNTQIPTYPNSELTVKNLVVNSDGTANTQHANITVAETLKIGGKMTVADGGSNVDNNSGKSKPTILTVGDAVKNEGQLLIDKLMDQSGATVENMTFENNTETVVYGTIVNNGKAKIVQATQTASDIPAKLAYSVANGSTGTGEWTDGIPSRIID